MRVRFRGAPQDHLVLQFTVHGERRWLREHLGGADPPVPAISGVHGGGHTAADCLFQAVQGRCRRCDVPVPGEG